MCWCAPTTQRWLHTSTTREVCVRTPFTGWRTRSLCGPRANSSRWEQFTFLGISLWEQTSCRGRGRGPGNGERVLARLRWTCLRLERYRTVPSGSLWLIQFHWGWMLWYRLGRGFVCTPFSRSLCSRELWRECAVLAGPSMILGPDFSPRRFSMGDSRQEGSPLTGGGYDPSLPPRVVEAVGVAPEGAQLIASGLSTEAVETILQSRAPSVRKLYALKWKLFTSWCGDCQLDPVNTVGTMLEFLQARFSTRLTHFTLKVYVAAIAAYHAPLSVGRHPLVTRFLHGALRLRPPAREAYAKWWIRMLFHILESSDLPSPWGSRLTLPEVGLRDVGPTHFSHSWLLFSHLSCAFPH